MPESVTPRSCYSEAVNNQAITLLHAIEIADMRHLKTDTGCSLHDSFECTFCSAPIPMAFMQSDCKENMPADTAASKSGTDNTSISEEAKMALRLKRFSGTPTDHILRQSSNSESKADHKRERESTGSNQARRRSKSARRSPDYSENDMSNQEDASKRYTRQPDVTRAPSELGAAPQGVESDSNHQIPVLASNTSSYKVESLRGLSPSFPCLSEVAQKLDNQLANPLQRPELVMGYSKAVLLIDTHTTDPHTLKRRLSKFRMICSQSEKVKYACLDSEWTPSAEIDPRQPIGLLQIAAYHDELGVHIMLLRIYPFFRFKGEYAWIKDFLECSSVKKIGFDFGAEDARRLAYLNVAIPRDSVLDLQEVFTQTVICDRSPSLKSIMVDMHFHSIKTCDETIKMSNWSDCSIAYNKYQIRYAAEDVFFTMLVWMQLFGDLVIYKNLLRDVALFPGIEALPDVTLDITAPEDAQSVTSSITRLILSHDTLKSFQAYQNSFHSLGNLPPGMTFGEESNSLFVTLWSGRSLRFHRSHTGFEAALAVLRGHS